MREGRYRRLCSGRDRQRSQPGLFAVARQQGGQLSSGLDISGSGCLLGRCFVVGRLGVLGEVSVQRRLRLAEDLLCRCNQRRGAALHLR